MNDFTTFLENNECIDVIYLDFAKAFDTVPHNRLLTKLHAYGINGNILQWIKAFLSNRKQRVRVNSSYSKYTNVTSGIPQGSILGPILFIIYINDLPDCVQSICKIFADDTKAYKPSIAHDQIQKDPFSLLEWSALWLLGFNFSKCGVLHIGTNNPQHEYYWDKEKSKPLKKVTSEKDVGVIFSGDLKFDQHISTIVSKANQLVGIVKRSFTHLDKDTFVKIYKAIIRPHIEYANVIWHPRFKKQMKCIESVQRRATKLVPGLKDLPYIQRLQQLDLPSVKYRQVRADLIQTYKIIHKIDNIETNDFFTIRDNNVTTRNSDLKLYKEFSKTSVRSNFLSNRVNNFWNSLTTTTRFSRDILTFKKLIDRELIHLKYVFDEKASGF